MVTIGPSPAQVEKKHSHLQLLEGAAQPANFFSYRVADKTSGMLQR
jgi:hypothetical protein